MPGPLSTDLRKRAVEAYLADDSLSVAATAKLFGVGTASLTRWLRKHREEGCVAPAPMGGDRRSVVDDEGLSLLRDLAPQHPDAIIEDFVELYEENTGIRVSNATMGRALHRAGLSRKKRTSVR